jgi:predicted signal transduction protein with EAL and GGDEF domain
MIRNALERHVPEFSSQQKRARNGPERFAVLSVYLTFSKGEPTLTNTMRCSRVAAERSKVLRTTDTVARVDDEEYAVLLEDLSKDGQAHLVMQKVQQALSEPVSFGGRNIQFDASVNIQVYPKPDKTEEVPPIAS